MEKYLVVGLGNMGEEYENTHHNIGFMVLDTIASKMHLSYAIARYGNISGFSIKNKRVILLKPSTYVNLSGKAIKYWLKNENIDIKNLLVVLDDIALPLGLIRLKKKGSDGGHNGLANIIYELDTHEFSRLRFGIGNNFKKFHQIEYVLSKLTDEEMKIVIPRIDYAVEAIISFVTYGIDYTMNFFNNK